MLTRQANAATVRARLWCKLTEFVFGLEISEYGLFVDAGHSSNRGVLMSIKLNLLASVAAIALAVPGVGSAAKM